MIAPELEASIDVAASPEAIWAVIADVTRVGEWSGECRGCVWIGGVQSPEQGSRFRGRNRRGGLRWSRVNEFVLVDEPNTLVWRTIAQFPYPDSVEWRIALTDLPDGTRVTESFRVLSIPKLMEWVVGLAVPAHRDRSGDLAEDLTRLKELVEAAGRD